MPTENSTDIPYQDRADVSEVFADQCRLTHFDGYALHVELVVSRPHMTGPDRAEQTMVPSARLVLSPIAAAQLQEHLSKALAVMEQQGVLKRVSPASSTRQ